MDHHTHASQLNSYHPQLMNHQIQGPVMNGVGGLQVPQVIFFFAIIKFQVFNFERRSTLFFIY